MIGKASRRTKTQKHEKASYDWYIEYISIKEEGRRQATMSYKTLVKQDSIMRYMIWDASHDKELIFFFPVGNGEALKHFSSGMTRYVF